MTLQDILDRQSRPQRHSTWVPKKRDWRYETGVFTHDDFKDSRKDSTVWDDMDYDCQMGKKKKGNRKVSRTSGGKPKSAQSMSHITVRSNTPSDDTLDAASEQAIEMHQVRAAKVSREKSRPHNLIIEDSTLSRFKPTGLAVRLRFTGLNIGKLQRILGTNIQQEISSTTSLYNQSLGSSQYFASPDTSDTSPPATANTFVTTSSDASSSSLFQCDWTDETRDFNMKVIRSSIQRPHATVKGLGPEHHWYTEAVGVNAIFPSGVPMSAKEIIAYYPHHVRWEGVMMRLTNSNYQGADIMGMQAFFRGPPTHNVTPSQIDRYQHDVIKVKLPSIETLNRTGGNNGTLHTDTLTRGKSLEQACKAMSLPSFDDLVRGLNHLPSGPDARGLTQCLTWYLRMRDKFTPQLDLNVLHTQSLIRALRQPLRPIQPENLDQQTLQEWRENGEFQNLDVWDEQPPCAPLLKQDKLLRAQIHLNLDNDSVETTFPLAIRYVLMLPFCRVQTFVRDALELGIQKAEQRRENRDRQEHGGKGLSQEEVKSLSVPKKRKVSPAYSLSDGNEGRLPLMIFRDTPSANGQREGAERATEVGRARGARSSVYGRR